MYSKFLIYLIIGWAFVVCQGILANFDGGGYLTQAQMQSRGIKGWSFMEHGGMWADVFIITPTVAYIVSRYQLPFTSVKSLLILLVMIGAVVCAGLFYSHKAEGIPEAHSHGGKTLPAGYVHGVYLLLTLWVLILFYFMTPNSAHLWRDLVLVSIALTPFFALGAVKFNENWRPDTLCWVQSYAGPIVLWTVTIWRIWNEQV